MAAGFGPTRSAGTGEGRTCYCRYCPAATAWIQVVIVLASPHHLVSTRFYMLLLLLPLLPCCYCLVIVIVSPRRLVSTRFCMLLLLLLPQVSVVLVSPRRPVSIGSVSR